MKQCLHVCSFVCVVPLLFLPVAATAQDRSAQDLRNLARAAFSESRYGEAEELFRQSLAKFEADPNTPPLQIAIGQGELGWVLVAKASFKEAESLLDGALRILNKNSAQNCDRISIILNNVGTVYYMTERYPRAEAVLKQALEKAERCLPSYTQTVLNTLGLLYAQTGKSKQATAVLQRALALIDIQPGTDIIRLQLAQTLNNLAGVYRAQRAPAQAEPLLLRAIELMENSKDGPHPALSATLLCIALEQLALLHSEQGKLNEAEVELRRAQEIEIDRAGANPERVAKLSFELAEVLTAKGEYHDARIFYQQALPADAKETAQTATVLERFSQLLRFMKANTQADEMEFRAKRIRAELRNSISVK
jgi:tetratricopeptide (TPR) repeat protein